MHRSFVFVILLTMLLSCSKEEYTPPITYNPAAISVGTTVSFYTDLGERTSNYTWHFGDGGSARNTGDFVTHQYTAAGDYLVDVEAVDTSGHTSQGTIRITVNP